MLHSHTFTFLFTTTLKTFEEHSEVNFTLDTHMFCYIWSKGKKDKEAKQLPVQFLCLAGLSLPCCDWLVVQILHPPPFLYLHLTTPLLLFLFHLSFFSVNWFLLHRPLHHSMQNKINYKKTEIKLCCRSEVARCNTSEQSFEEFNTLFWQMLVNKEHPRAPEGCRGQEFWSGCEVCPARAYLREKH